MSVARSWLNRWLRDGNTVLSGGWPGAGASSFLDLSNVHVSLVSRSSGQWPYVIGFVHVVRDGSRRLYGFGVYVEGDLTTDYYRSWDACNEAISRQAFWYWNAGQSDGPKDLAASFEDMQADYKVPSQY